MWIKESTPIGFIDWKGDFYTCSYGEHSKLAFLLAKQALRERRESAFKIDDIENMQRKDEMSLGLVRIEEWASNGAIGVHLPATLNNKQKQTLAKLCTGVNEFIFDYGIFGTKTELIGRGEKLPEVNLTTKYAIYNALKEYEKNPLTEIVHYEEEIIPKKEELNTKENNFVEKIIKEKNAERKKSYEMRNKIEDLKIPTPKKEKIIPIPKRKEPEIGEIKCKESYNKGIYEMHEYLLKSVEENSERYNLSEDPSAAKIILLLLIQEITMYANEKVNGKRKLFNIKITKEGEKNE